MEMDKVALGQIFLQHFIFCLPVIVPPVLWIWPVWFGMPQLSCNAEGLSHTLLVQLQKIIDVNWEARCIKGVLCLSMRGHVALLLEGSICENCLNHQLVREI
jgi:hypothetical protein